MLAHSLHQAAHDASVDLRVRVRVRMGCVPAPVYATAVYAESPPASSF